MTPAVLVLLALLALSCRPGGSSQAEAGLPRPFPEGEDFLEIVHALPEPPLAFEPGVPIEVELQVDHQLASLEQAYLILWWSTGLFTEEERVQRVATQEVERGIGTSVLSGSVTLPERGAGLLTVSLHARPDADQPGAEPLAVQLWEPLVPVGVTDQEVEGEYGLEIVEVSPDPSGELATDPPPWLAVSVRYRFLSPYPAVLSAGLYSEAEDLLYPLVGFLVEAEPGQGEAVIEGSVLLPEGFQGELRVRAEIVRLDGRILSEADGPLVSLR